MVHDKPSFLDHVLDLLSTATLARHSKCPIVKLDRFFAFTFFKCKNRGSFQEWSIETRDYRVMDEIYSRALYVSSKLNVGCAVFISEPKINPFLSSQRLLYWDEIVYFT